MYKKKNLEWRTWKRMTGGTRRHFFWNAVLFPQNNNNHNNNPDFPIGQRKLPIWNRNFPSIQTNSPVGKYSMMIAESSRTQFHTQIRNFLRKNTEIQDGRKHTAGKNWAQNLRRRARPWYRVFSASSITWRQRREGNAPIRSEVINTDDTRQWRALSIAHVRSICAQSDLSVQLALN